MRAVPRLAILFLIGAVIGLVIAAGTWLAGCPPDLARAQSDPTRIRSAKPAVDPGRDLFTRGFTAEEGLGPFFNAISCAECHEFPLGGVGDEMEIHGEVGEIPGFGCEVRIFHSQSTSNGPEPIPDGVPVAQRTTPDLFGLAVVDGIADSDIIAFNEGQKEFVGGRPHFLPDGRIGKFGRKAVAATLAEFNRGAFFNEMGVTVPFPPFNVDDDSIPDPEFADLEQLKALDRFVRSLRLDPPRQTRPQALGAELFHQVLCSKCHVPEWSFTDVLLHDVATGDEDICVGDAAAEEFRTEPLVGLRRGRVFLHDGRAKTIEEAILMHGNDAQESRALFNGLRPNEKAALMIYLRKL